MPTITFKESSAAQAVGTNLLPSRFATSMRPRRIRRVGIVGSAAVGDAAVDVYYGDHFVGTFFNTSAGANLVPLEAKDLVPVSDSTINMPGEPLSVIVSDAGATNVLAITLEIEEF